MPTTRRKTHLKNMMNRHIDEPFLKSIWLTKNLKILNRVPDFRKTVNDSAKFLIPMLVCNFVVDEFGPSRPLLTHKVLSYFLRKFDFSIVPNKDLTINDVIRGPRVSQPWTLRTRRLSF